MNEREKEVRDLFRTFLEENDLEIVKDDLYDGLGSYSGTEFYVAKVGQKEAEDVYFNLREVL